jgi:tetratricopeptide (TPR) repeat protein
MTLKIISSSKRNTGKFLKKIKQKKSLNPMRIWIKKLFILFSFSIFLSASLWAQEAQSNFIIEGIKMYDKADYEGALEMYKKALSSNPASIQAKYEIASVYMQLKDYTNAIKYSEKVIAANRDYVDQAYILKGSALDNLHKPAEAVAVYKLALKKYPKNQLLYYNLALTSFGLKDFKTTDDASIKALKLNPLHANSHFLLALSQLTQGKRVPAMLALYNFLLLEPKSKRSPSALQALDDEWKKITVKQKPGDKDGDEFYTASLMLDILEASKSNEANKNKPAIVLFAENTNTFFTTLGESKKVKKDFWWNFYVDYFYTLSKNNHTEALCYYITQSKDNAYDEWIKDNLKTMEAFSEWYTKYLHKF